MSERMLTYVQAIREALDLCMAKDVRVHLLGLGASDPLGVFGSTRGLVDTYGPRRVMDMPISENAMTGVAVGMAIRGLRPVMTHLRTEFALGALDQIVNQAAKWHYMFGGQATVPLVIRMIVGRGWGQGPQHSQSLHTWFAHVPGLKVILPATPADAKGMLIAAIEDVNPVICVEHRWLYGIHGPVPEGLYRVPIGPARVVCEGADVTVAAIGYMTLEAVRAADTLRGEGVEVEVLDLRTLHPFDDTSLLASVRKTGHLVVADHGGRTAGFAAEVVARVAERGLVWLRAAPRRITLPDLPTPTTRALANHYYPGAQDIAAAVRGLLGRPARPLPAIRPEDPLDVPDTAFRGPF